MSKETGKVKWFNNKKGFGFIERASGGDVFVHYSAIVSDGNKTLKEGDSVEFTITQGPQGFQAESAAKVKKKFKDPATIGFAGSCSPRELMETSAAYGLPRDLEFSSQPHLGKN